MAQQMERSSRALAVRLVAVVAVLVAAGAFAACAGGGSAHDVTLSRSSRVLVVDVKTGDVRQLTDGSESAAFARWSPVDSAIGLSVGGPESARAEVVDAETGKPALSFAETKSPTPSDVAWSPRGDELAAFEMRLPDATTPGESVLRVASTKDGTVRELATFPGANGSPGSLAWSPDGRSIAVTVRRDAAVEGNRHDMVYDLGVVDAETGAVRWLTSDEPAQGSPAWAPDSQHIAVVSRDLTAGMGTIQAFSLDGAAPRTIVDDSLGCLGMAYSPDGKTLALVDALASDPGRRTRLYTIDLATSKLTQLLPSATSSPSWSPDGETIAVASEGKLDLVSRDTSVRTLLDISDAQFNGPAWSPGGDRLVVTASKRAGD